MDKNVVIARLNEEWKSYFKKSRLVWVTSSFPERLICFFENLTFLDAEMQLEENGYVGESYHNYLTSVSLKSKIGEETFSFSIQTVDEETDMNESWAIDGFISLHDSYEGSGYIEGDYICKRIGLDTPHESQIREVLAGFELRAKTDRFLYANLKESEQKKADEIKKEFFNKPMTVKAVKNFRGYLTVEFEDGTIIQNATRIYKK